MVLEGSARCIKYLVFIFNFLFFVCGVGLMAVGIYVQLKVGDFAELSTVKYLTGSILIITVGAVIALVSFFGCCGAVKENRCFLCLFFVILLLILCAEVAGTSLGYIYRDKIELRLREDLNASLMEYGQDNQEGITKAYNILQQKEKCCGVNSYEDWQASFYSNGNHTIVPDSCCITEEPNCGKPFVVGGKNIYKEGCYKKVRALLKDNLIIIFGFGLAVAFIQVLAMVFAMVLICQIGKQGEFA